MTSRANAKESAVASFVVGGNGSCRRGIPAERTQRPRRATRAARQLGLTARARSANKLLPAGLSLRRRATDVHALAGIRDLE